jgi:hypothetical protein
MTDIEAQDAWDAWVDPALEDPSTAHHDRLERVKGL